MRQFLTLVLNFVVLDLRHVVVVGFGIVHEVFPADQVAQIAQVGPLSKSNLRFQATFSAGLSLLPFACPPAGDDFVSL